jgi:hypothetical protein
MRGIVPMWAQGRPLSYNQPMRSLFGKSRRNSYFTIALLATIVVLAAMHRGDNALGQSQAPTPFPPTPGQNTGRPPFGQESDSTQDPMMRHAQEEAAKRRNIDRQNKLNADSDRIVQLAQELSTAGEPDGKGASSPALAKKAEEIEKLARNVKDLMKSE